MPRKGENIRKRKDGRWEARYFKGRDEHGRIRYGYVYAKTYRQVREKKTHMIQQMVKKDVCIPIESEINTIECLSQIWMRDKKERVKPSTYANYESIIMKHIEGVFEKNLKQITKKDIYSFVESLAKKELQASTIRSITDVLRYILRKGSQMGIIENEIAECCIYRSGRNTVRVCSGDDREKIEQILFSIDNLFATGILLMLSTGIRVGELCGIRWEDINFEEKTFRIIRTIQRIKNDGNEREKGKTYIHIGIPKTETSLRAIPIPTKLYSLLQKYKSLPSHYLLTGSSSCMEPRNVQKRFETILRRNQITHYNLHSLRHGFASTAIEKGIDCKTVSSILGHSSTKITLDLYVHSSRKMMQDCVDAIL